VVARKLARRPRFRRIAAIFAKALAFCALNGRLVLVTGLAAGLLLPALAQAMAPLLPWMVTVLLFLSAFRIGPAETLGQLRLIGRSLGALFILQLALPVAAFGMLYAAGLAGTAPAIALVLMLAAPPITGAPNFAILAGQNPAPAMRLLILGTAAFPATALLAFALLPTVEGGLLAAGWLLIKVMGAVALGFAARSLFMARPTAAQTKGLDGLGVLALAIIVIGLMAGISPLLATDPWALAGWMALAFAANFGLQAGGFAITRGRMAAADRAAFGIIAGNRNIALFLIALPPETIAVLLPFIGSYQIPMYLTPLLLQTLARRP
jgi:arsenite transporter